MITREEGGTVNLKEEVGGDMLSIKFGIKRIRRTFRRSFGILERRANRGIHWYPLCGTSAGTEHNPIEQGLLQTIQPAAESTAL